MRTLAIFVPLMLVACTNANPDYCDTQTPCGGGAVCNVERRVCESATRASNDDASVPEQDGGLVDLSTVVADAAQALPDAECTDIDCAGVCGGNAREDKCGTCDEDSNNDCLQDCNGVWGGTAVRDTCGVCDSDPRNDCWAGEHGVLHVPESTSFKLADTGIWWSERRGDVGYLYEDNTLVAYVSSRGPCSPDHSGYDGIRSVQSLQNAAALSYSKPSERISFGARTSHCYQGMLVFQHGDQYGVLDFLFVDAAKVLTVEYWLGDPGVTDFSRAP